MMCTSDTCLIGFSENVTRCSIGEGIHSSCSKGGFTMGDIIKHN